MPEKERRCAADTDKSFASFKLTLRPYNICLVPTSPHQVLQNNNSESDSRLGWIPAPEPGNVHKAHVTLLNCMGGKLPIEKHDMHRWLRLTVSS